MATPGQAALVLAAGVLAWGHLRLVVPRLAEPDDADSHPGWRKPRYATLASGTWQLVALALGCLAAVPVLWRPGWLAPLLLVLAGPLVALALVDLRTTWLPLPLTRWSWVLGLAAALAAVALVEAPLRSSLALRMAGAAAATAALFWLVWRVGGGLGYGDVRLAPLLALAPAALSWQCWCTYLLLGTITGAVAGLVVTLWRRRHPHPLGQVFPYGPPLWLGAVLAVAFAG